MKQRLGIATALLGDPPVLLFDEPVNGLDPEGVLWVRGLFRRLAAEGRTVFVSSHLMSEMENTADQLVVIGRGELHRRRERARTSPPAAPGRASPCAPPDAAALAAALTAAGARRSGAPATAAHRDRAERATRIGDLAFDHRVLLHELTTRTASLEEAFMELTADSVEYLAGGRPPMTASRATIRRPGRRAAGPLPRPARRRVDQAVVAALDAVGARRQRAGRHRRSTSTPPYADYSNFPTYGPDVAARSFVPTGRCSTPSPTSPPAS